MNEWFIKKELLDFTDIVTWENKESCDKVHKSMINCKHLTGWI